MTETPIAPPPVDLPRRLVAEAIGSAFLLIAVVGSGIMAETLSPDDVGLQLFENAAATAGALIALIVMFANVSGAHFNPAVTLAERLLGTMTTRDAWSYVGVQIVGGCIGVVLANAMFGAQTGRGWIFLSEKERNSAGELLAEVIAMIGLLLVIHRAVRHAKPHVVACRFRWRGPVTKIPLAATAPTSKLRHSVLPVRSVRRMFILVQHCCPPPVIWGIVLPS